jgi:hypothetical protein
MYFHLHLKERYNFPFTASYETQCPAALRAGLLYLIIPKLDDKCGKYK